MNHWFRDDELISEVPVGERALHYGDGLFETIAIRDGQPRLWDYHLERLEKGCEKLGLMKPDRRALQTRLQAALGKAKPHAATATAKIILTAGVSQRGYARRTPTAATVYIGIYPAAAVPADCYRDGVEVMVSGIRLAMFSVTAGCKTLNRIEQVLARSESVAVGAFEGLTMDAEGRLICGTMSNVFTVSNKSIATPSLDRCGVAGVMRRHVIDVLGQRGQAVSVGDISEPELMGADEVFLCNSQFGIIPVRRCEKRTWAEHAVTRTVMAIMAENGIEECAR